VADDDSELLRLNAKVLDRSGYQVATLEDGAAAWEALQTNNFNLLITDHDMPNLTGVELVKKLRSARMDMPVILATGRLPQKEIARDPSLLLAAMLPKPFSISELLETVKAALRATDSAGG
jgi:two-component system cell cycle response regulator CpdR